MNRCTLMRALRLRTLSLCIAALAILHMPLGAQERTGTVIGRVLTDAGLPAAHVVLRSTSPPVSVTTNEYGVFRIGDVPAGTVTLVVEAIGWRTMRESVAVTAGEVARIELRLEPQALLLDEVVVTTSREAQRRAETPATVHGITAATIDRVKPTHPSELLNRVPGVWVNVTGGEGHMAAIRHPMTTNPVYLYLENGVPTRSTGFFNHNALYEIDVPHAGRIEIVKGPATALYGSDAIGGMINVMSRPVTDVAPFTVSAEAGAHGFGRVLAGARVGGAVGELNITRTDGWRDATGYDRQSGTVRWERAAGTSTVRAMLTYSRIDQQTAGTSAIAESDFAGEPTRNYTPISYREVEAVRASAAWERLSGSTLLSVTPFARWNRMEMLPNWTLTFDPHISRTGHASIGALVKARRDFVTLRSRMIGGIDLDYSPGRHREWSIIPVRDEAVFSSFTRNAAIYDYDVAFRAASPYLQLEASPLADVRVVAGLRYDVFGYDYDNALGELQGGMHRRPASTQVAFSRASPKVGVAWAPAPSFRLFGSYGQGFRAPSEGQLFRQGRALNPVALRPVRAENIEAGAGGTVAGVLSWDVAVYHMVKRDDILTFTHADGSTEAVNAGETLHRGVEAGAAVTLPFALRLDATYSRARHTYEEWVPRAGTDLGGRTMESAPDRTAGVGLTWAPQQATVSLEVQHVGPFWMDAANTTRYDGHTTIAARAEVPVTPSVALFARLTNALNERYAEMAQFTTARGAEYAPGMPRSLYIGARYR
jgi:iron complex outermembrane recepter protein